MESRTRRVIGTTHVLVWVVREKHSKHVKDMIILTAGSQAFSLLSNWLWLLLLLAPLRAFYMLWTSVIAPWIFQPAEEDVGYAVTGRPC